MAQNSDDLKKSVLPPTNVASSQLVLVKGHTHTKGQIITNFEEKVVQLKNNRHILKSVATFVATILNNKL